MWTGLRPNPTKESPFRNELRRERPFSGVHKGHGVRVVLMLVGRVEPKCAPLQRHRYLTPRCT